MLKKKNTIINLIAEVLTELGVVFEKNYNIITDIGPLVFDFCLINYNLMIDCHDHLTPAKNAYCVMNGAHYIEIAKDDKAYIKKKISAWIKYIKDPIKNQIPMEVELRT